MRAVFPTALSSSQRYGVLGSFLLVALLLTYYNDESMLRFRGDHVRTKTVVVVSGGEGGSSSNSSSSNSNNPATSTLPPLLRWSMIAHPPPSFANNTAGSEQQQQQQQQLRTTAHLHPHRPFATYVRRGRPTNASTYDALQSQYGAWTLVDKKLESRPTMFYDQYPHRDVPAHAWPPNAWQTDRAYVRQFVNQARALVQRAQEAILEEYGWGALHHPPNMTLVERGEALFPTTNWLPSDDMKGLVRRVLHAVMTQDTFIMTLTGHSAAAGHGNHFQQSYMMQAQKVLEPVLARLGVHMMARNVAMGGLGTLQSTMAASSTHGPRSDMVIWDSGMTENGGYALPLLAFQAWHSSDRAPLLWYHAKRHGGVDTLQQAGLPVAFRPVPAFHNVPVTSADNVTTTTPWAVRCENLKDASLRQTICDSKTTTWRGTCWYERDDVHPGTPQVQPGGRAKWHPGWRWHQINGRGLAFVVLMALDTGLAQWQQAPNYQLADADWHVTDYYQSIMDKVVSMPCPNPHDDDNGVMSLPDLVCRVPLQSRTGFFPRWDPVATSLQSIAKAGIPVANDLVDTDGFQAAATLYDGPDVFIPDLEPPMDDAHALDVLAILENGVDFAPILARAHHVLLPATTHAASVYVGRTAPVQHAAVTPPGQGWSVEGHGLAAGCDGTYQSWCGRHATQKCLLQAHHDNRGGLLFDGLSGWMVMELSNMRHGYVVVQLEPWYGPGANPATEGWTCENNVCPPQQHVSGDVATNKTVDSHHQRNLKGAPAPPYCDDFRFEFAIDGVVTSWTKDEFLARRFSAQRVVNYWTLLDDRLYVPGNAPRNVELALRMTGCARIKTFKLTHIVWA